MGGVSRLRSGRNNQGLGLTRSPPTKRRNSMLIDKIREFVKLRESMPSKAGKEFLDWEMAQALLAVDDVLKNWEQKGGMRGQWGIKELRKAIESTDGDV